jgi:hypothetical protein
LAYHMLSISFKLLVRFIGIFVSLILWLPSGKNHQEDCAEAAVPELQALLPACHQGLFLFYRTGLVFVLWSLHSDFLNMSLFCGGYTESFLFVCAEVQAFRDRWRQEGQGNISFLNCFRLSWVVVVQLVFKISLLGVELKQTLSCIQTPVFWHLSKCWLWINEVL